LIRRATRAESAIHAALLDIDSRSAEKEEGKMSTLYSFTVFRQAIRCLFLVAAIVALTALPARAVVLKVTISDAIYNFLGDDWPLGGWIIYDPIEEKILDFSIENDFLLFFPGITDVRTVTYSGSWKSFAFLNTIFPPIISPTPEHGCEAFSDTGSVLYALCITPSEPITKPGQHVAFGGYAINGAGDTGPVTGWLDTSLVAIPEPMSVSTMLFVIYGFAIYMMRSRRLSAQEMPVT
jgi:hypothetical protein